MYLWDQCYCQWTLQQPQPQARKLLSFKYFLRRMGDITDKYERERQNRGDCVVAKLRRDVRNRIQETAKELGEEENRVVKDLIAGCQTSPKSAEKQRWADVEESEVIGESEMAEEYARRDEVQVERSCQRKGRTRRRMNEEKSGG